MVEPRKLHKIWIEQCEAACTIKDRYELKAAFDYLVAEKLLNFTEAVSEHRAFAQELPRFVSSSPHGDFRRQRHQVGPLRRH